MSTNRVAKLDISCILLDEETPRPSTIIPQTSNPSAGGLIKCDKCRKYFTKRMHYNRHRKTHELPYKCNKCSKGFALRNDLDRHAARHEAVTSRFICEWPGCPFKGASRKDNLLKHMAMKHTGGDDVELRKLYNRSVEKVNKIIQNRTEFLAPIDAILNRKIMSVDEQPATGSVKLHPKDGNSQVRLMQAMEEGYQAVERLLGSHYNDGFGRNLLLRASATGQEPLVRLLLSCKDIGMIVNVADNRGCTALQLAVQAKSEAVFRALLECKDVDLNRESHSSQGKLLFDAAESGQEAILQYLLKPGEINPNICYCYTALAIAANRGHVGIVRLLLGHNDIQPNLAPTDYPKSKFRPLTEAIENGHNGVVRLLIRHKNIDVNETGYHWGCQGETPIALAIKHGNKEVIKLLLQHNTFDFRSGGEFERVLRYLATPQQHGYKERQQQRQHPSIVESSEGALLYAAAQGNEALASLLLETGVNPSCRALDGSTALHFASTNGHISMVKLLLETGADANSIDVLGGGVLFTAVNCRHTEIVQMLLKAGADTKYKDSRGQTPLDCAFRHESNQIVTLLLEHGADLQHQNIFGVTPLL